MRFYCEVRLNQQRLIAFLQDPVIQVPVVIGQSHAVTTEVFPCP